MHHPKILTHETQKKEYLILKETLLSEYRRLAESIEYAVDKVEEGLLREKRGELVRQIKSLSAKINEMHTQESLA